MAAGGRDKVSGKDQLLQLQKAIDGDDPASIAVLLTQGVNPNERLRHLNLAPPAVEYAVVQLKKKAVQELLKQGADPNLWDEGGHEKPGVAQLDERFSGHYANNAVTAAVTLYSRDPEVLNLILKFGGNPNTITSNGNPVIIRFINDRNCDAVKMLKNAGANLDVNSRAGDPLVIDAALASDWDAVLCLLELGAKYENFDFAERNAPYLYNLADLLKKSYPGPGSPMWPIKLKVRDFLHKKRMAVPILSEAQFEMHQVNQEPQLDDPIEKQLGKAKFEVEVIPGKSLPAYNLVFGQIKYTVCVPDI